MLLTQFVPSRHIVAGTTTPESGAPPSDTLASRGAADLGEPELGRRLLLSQATTTAIEAMSASRPNMTPSRTGARGSPTGIASRWHER